MHKVYHYALLLFPALIYVLNLNWWLFKVYSSIFKSSGALVQTPIRLAARVIAQHPPIAKAVEFCPETLLTHVNSTAPLPADMVPFRPIINEMARTIKQLPPSTSYQNAYAKVVSAHGRPRLNPLPETRLETKKWQHAGYPVEWNQQTNSAEWVKPITLAPRSQKLFPVHWNFTKVFNKKQRHYPKAPNVMASLRVLPQGDTVLKGMQRLIEKDNGGIQITQQLAKQIKAINKAQGLSGFRDKHTGVSSMGGRHGVRTHKPYKWLFLPDKSGKSLTLYTHGFEETTKVTGSKQHPVFAVERYKYGKTPPPTNDRGTWDLAWRAENPHGLELHAPTAKEQADKRLISFYRRAMLPNGVLHVTGKSQTPRYVRWVDNNGNVIERVLETPYKRPDVAEDYSSQWNRIQKPELKIYQIFKREFLHKLPPEQFRFDGRLRRLGKQERYQDIVNQLVAEQELSNVVMAGHQAMTNQTYATKTLFGRIYNALRLHPDKRRPINIDTQALPNELMPPGLIRQAIDSAFGRIGRQQALDGHNLIHPPELPPQETTSFYKKLLPEFITVNKAPYWVTQKPWKGLFKQNASNRSPLETKNHTVIKASSQQRIKSAISQLRAGQFIIANKVQIRITNATDKATRSFASTKQKAKQAAQRTAKTYTSAKNRVKVSFKKAKRYIKNRSNLF